MAAESMGGRHRCPRRRGSAACTVGVVSGDVLTPSVRRQVLRDPTADAELLARGVASVPYLSPEEVDEILRAYWELVPSSDEGLSIDYMRPDRALVRTLAEVLEPVLQRHLDDTLVDHRIVLATFVVKHPGESSAMFLHDDRSYVDERKFRTATMWIPLTDVGPQLRNGGLQVVPGSHLLPTGWAGSNTPDMIRPFESTLRRHLEPVEATAGTAVLYDTRVLHASDPNLSDRPRVAVACAVAPAEAQLVHVRAVGRRTRHVHAVDEDFFLDHHPREIEQRMPDDCPVIEHLEDEAELDAGSLRRVLGPIEVDPSTVPVPGDLAEHVSSQRWSEIRDAVRPIPTQAGSDVRLDVQRLTQELPPVPVLDVGDLRGNVGLMPLRRRFRRAQPVPAPIAPRAVATSRIARDQDLIVLDSGARITLRAPRTPRWRTEVLTLEGPVVGAGIGCGEGSAMCRIGHPMIVPQLKELRLWNDGPGQLIVLASRIPDPTDRLGRLLLRR